MSWQQYADNIVASGKISGAIVASSAGQQWATKNLSADANELATLAKAFQNADGIRSSGIHLGKTKYMTLTAEPDVIRGKKV